MHGKSIRLALLLAVLTAAPARASQPLHLLAPQYDDTSFLGGENSSRLPARQSFALLGGVWQAYALIAGSIITGVTVGLQPSTPADLERLQFRLELAQGIPLGVLELFFLGALCTDPGLEGHYLEQLPVFLLPAVMYVAGWLAMRSVYRGFGDRREAWPAWAGAASQVAASTLVMLPILALDFELN